MTNSKHLSKRQVHTTLIQRHDRYYYQPDSDALPCEHVVLSGNYTNECNQQQGSGNAFAHEWLTRVRQAPESYETSYCSAGTPHACHSDAFFALLLL